MKKRKVSNSTPFALGIVTRKGGDLRKQGSVSEASIARPGVAPIAALQGDRWTELGNARMYQ
jgi:hypothetical protein